MKSISIQALLLSILLVMCFSVSAQNTATAEENHRHLKVAEAMFQERCRKAGEKIRKTVDNIDGIYLMKIRPEKDNFSNQFAMDDPYGRDFGGDAYIKSFLAGFFESNYRRPEIATSERPPHLAYRYVEAVDPADGMRYRYTGSMKVVGRKDVTAPNVRVELQRNPNYDLNIYAFQIDRVPASGPAPRYGVTYDDISTQEEREYWIAGSSLKVIDLKTDEVIAERIGYMMDRGQGDTSGGRSPWLLAADNACPGFAPRHGATAQPLQTENFVERVLRPKLEK